MCLAVTCHLRFWQNDWDLLRATAITWGWKGYQNKSAQKVDLEKKIFSCQDSNPGPSDHESDAVNLVSVTSLCIVTASCLTHSVKLHPGQLWVLTSVPAALYTK